MRPQEMPRYIADGHLDAAITGSDWVMENDVDLVQDRRASSTRKSSMQPTRWVLVVPENSPIKRLEDLEGKLVATEMVGFTKRVFAERKVNVNVENFPGACHRAKATSTGSSMRSSM